MKALISLILGAAMVTSSFLLYFSVNNQASNLPSNFNTSETDWTDQKTDVATAVSGSVQMVMFQDLAPLLKSAATEDKTIIITSVNWEWAQPNSFLDIFLQSFQNGENIDHLVKHLIIVAFDARAFERCKLLHRYCFELKTGKNFTAPLGFMSKGYVELVWEKIRLQQYILELGFNFVFTDVDVMWFRNPLKHVTVYADLTMSCDYFNGNPDDVNNFPNTGLFYVKSNNKTAKMMQHWHESGGRFPPDHDQNIFNKIKHELVDSFRIKIRYVDPKYFGGFCRYGKDLNEICTMHSNCCPSMGNKLSDLKSLGNDWKNYSSLSVEDKKKGLVEWRVPGKCIH
ncbi:hypothetical protein LUZ60_013798 [Juncus effusus]|nr:hypothetical protein LUZ60_013798 [Juncus effusus]